MFVAYAQKTFENHQLLKCNISKIYNASSLQYVSKACCNKHVSINSTFGFDYQILERKESTFKLDLKNFKDRNDIK